MSDTPTERTAYQTPKRKCHFLLYVKTVVEYAFFTTSIVHYQIVAL